MSHHPVPPIVSEWILDSLRKQVDSVQEEAQTFQILKEQGELSVEAIDVYQEMLDSLTWLDSVLSRLERTLRL